MSLVVVKEIRSKRIEELRARVSRARVVRALEVVVASRSRVGRE